jgi:hypothetical protein
MLTAGRKNEQGFCLRREGLCRTVEQDAAQLLCDGRPSRLSRAQDFMALFGKELTKPRGLCCFSAPFPALQRNEDAL